MKTNHPALLVLLAFQLSAPSVLTLRAGSACCQGAGEFGLDSPWTDAAHDSKGPKTVTFSNASFESSRELFAELDDAFAKHWVQKTGFKLSVNGSNGPTEAQYRSIVLGAEPDVLTLDNPGVVDELARKQGLLPVDWRTRLPNNSSPYTTTVVFVVEKGNPKNIRDWSDLVRDDVSVITPDPRTSGRGQWNFLAAWGSVLRAGGTEEKAREFVDKLYARVPVLNSSARGAAQTFTQRRTGDVLVVWESDAYEIVKQSSDRKLVVLTPPSTILVEPPVTWVDRNVGKHENARVAVSFLKFLYTPEAQAIIARHHFRPRLPQSELKIQSKLAETTAFTVDEQFGGWTEATKHHFAAGQSADQVLHTTAQLTSSPIPRG